MAGKKGKVNNMEFMRDITQNAHNATTEVLETLQKLGEKEEEVNSGKKKLQHIDISLMDDAPEDWNRYPKLKDTQEDRYLELKMSIFERGIEEPCVLWERPDGRYMILAGHNRKDISQEIVEECEAKGLDTEKYRYVPCLVYGETEIDEKYARNIIDDTNLYRDFSKLPRRVKTEIMKFRMESYKRRRYAGGQRIDQLAKEFGVKKTAIYEEMAISEGIFEPLREMYYSGKLKRKAVLKFNYYARDTQEWIYDNYVDKIDDTKALALKKNMGREEISAIFETDREKIRKITVNVPESRVEEFKELYDSWILRQG